MIRVDTVVVRTDLDTGKITAVIYTPENDSTSGEEGVGDSLYEALYDLAENIEEALCGRVSAQYYSPS